MAIELPEDAEGRDIPSDTKVSYDAGGNRYEVSRLTYSVSRDYGNRDVVFVTGYDRYASETFPKPPDSREKSKEDLKAVEVCGDSPELEDPVCAYAHDIGEKCAECKLYAGGCTVDMCKDIASRIHKPRGEGK